jgi:hypothetical protein
MKVSRFQRCVQFLAQLFFGLLLVLFGTTWTRAQDHTSQTPDLQQLQNKLERLEKEMAELKQQMAG